VLATFRLLGLLYLLLIVGCAALLRNPPAGYAPPGWTARRSQAAGVAEHASTLAAALRTWRWYGLWLILCLAILPGAAVISAAAAMAQDVSGVGAAVAAGLVISNALGNVTGRVLWATLSDRLGYRNVFVALFLVQAAGLAVLPMARAFGLLSACSFALMLCNGGIFSTMPACVAHHFGTRHVGRVYGLMLTAWGTAAIAGPLVMAAVFDATRHYGPALQLFALLMLGGALLPLLVCRAAPRVAASNGLRLLQGKEVYG
jgi:OFA family oxalate/formate antiporter-like MFS transporter